MNHLRGKYSHNKDKDKKSIYIDDDDCAFEFAYIRALELIVMLARSLAGSTDLFVCLTTIKRLNVIKEGKRQRYAIACPVCVCIANAEDC